MPYKDQNDIQAQIHYRLVEELSASEKRYRYLVQHLHEVVFELDEEGHLTFINKAWEKLIGYPVENSLKSSLSDYICKEDLALWEELMGKVRSGGSKEQTQELKLKARDQEIVWGEVTIRLNAAKGLIGSIFNVSDRKKAEWALEKAKHAAELSNEAKSMFLATMSHEIRTPLNAIIGTGELLSESPLNLQQKEYLQVCQRASSNLLDLINDILDISIIEEGRLKVEEVDFDPYDQFSRVVNLVDHQIQEKKLDFTWNIDASVPVLLKGDSARLRQVLLNYITNAIKFTETGTICVTVKLEQQDGKACSLQFSVEDTGIGIAQEHLPMIFERFTQVDRSFTRKYGGAGLGLTIVKRLVELMGGKVWVKSQLGAGSTFSFTLPFKKGSSSLDQKEVDAREDVRVLVVANDPLNRLKIRNMVRRLGTTVHMLKDPSNCLDELRRAGAKRSPYHLVVMTCERANVNKLALAKEIQRTPEFQDAKLLILNADDQPVNMVNLGKPGGRNCFIKPIKQEILASAILEVLRKRGQESPDLERNTNPDRQNEAPLRILLAEDDHDNATIIRHFLKEKPYHIDWVENGQLALEQFKGGDYDLVIMDIQMPVMDGYAALKRIRQWEKKGRHQSAPILALTANARKEESLHCLRAGFSAYLSKPVRKTSLLEAIHQNCHRLERDLVLG
jgi:PAS domain S-box-containing protein